MLYLVQGSGHIFGLGRFHLFGWVIFSFWGRASSFLGEVVFIFLGEVVLIISKNGSHHVCLVVNRQYRNEKNLFKDSGDISFARNLPLHWSKVDFEVALSSKL